MKILTNSRKVKLHYFLATSLTFAGILMIISSTAILLFRGGEEAVTSTPILIIATILSVTGIRMTFKWLKPPTAEDALANGLKGLGKDALLLNYYKPINHILISQHGLFSLTVFSHDVHFQIEGSHWENKDDLRMMIRQFLTQGRLGDPLKQASEDGQTLHKWLREHVDEKEYTVQPIIVFTNPDAILDIEEQPSIPVTTTEKGKYTLKSTIRQYNNPTLPADTIDQIVETLKIKNRQED